MHNSSVPNKLQMNFKSRSNASQKLKHTHFLQIITLIKPSNKQYRKPEV